MSDRIVRFHLDPGLLTGVAEGQHNFLCKVRDACIAAGLDVQLVANDPATRSECVALPGFDLFHMDEPTHDRAVTVRRVYHYPFWAIERTGVRWNWDVARSEFPGASNRAETERFARFWRNRLFPGEKSLSQGYIYVPLQGRIRQHRSFQTCAPIDMIRSVLTHDDRPVTATLHPNETYDAADLAALEALQTEHPRLNVETGGMVGHLAACDYVVTQNSSAAFNGFFFRKPAILFARIDFHHIAVNAADLGVAGAFEAVRTMRPDYDGYLHWFWQVMSINAGRPEAQDRIAARLRGFGWPV